MSNRIPKAKSRAKAMVEAAEIYIYGAIGESWWDDTAMSASQFADELNVIPKNQPIHLRINSPGGAVGDGLAIYNLIKTRKNVTAFIDGYALSAASFIPLACSKVVSPVSSIWMVHNASGMCWGTAADMRSMADSLDTHSQVMLDIYCDRTDKSQEEMKALLDAETWMTGKEAYEMGFADELMELDEELDEELDDEMDDDGEPAMARVIPIQFAAKASDAAKQKLAQYGWQFGRVAAIAHPKTLPPIQPTARHLDSVEPKKEPIEEPTMPKELETPTPQAVEPTANSDRVTQMSDEIRDLKIRLAAAEQSKVEAKENGDRSQLINQYWQLRATALNLYAVENKLTEEDFNIDFNEDPQIDIESITSMAREDARIDLGMKDRMLRRAAARQPIERVTSAADVAKLQNASLKSSAIAEPVAPNSPAARSQSKASAEALPLLPDTQSAQSPSGLPAADYAAAIVAKYTGKAATK